MIFVCVGSRQYQFDRLLEKIDELVSGNQLNEEIFAQIGQSKYIPRHYRYVRYLSSDDFQQRQIDADLIISHGGTGALISALKLGKKVVAVPRLAKYKEHIDDHQIQVCKKLEERQYLKAVYEISDLYSVIIQVQNQESIRTYSERGDILSIIDGYIARHGNCRGNKNKK